MKQHLNTLFVATQGAYLRKDGQTVAVGTNNHKLTFWSVDTLQELFSLSLKHVVISALAFEQSGAYLAVGTSSLQQGEPIQGQIEILSAVR